MPRSTPATSPSGGGSSCCTGPSSTGCATSSTSSTSRSIPLSLYFKDGRAKVELALARGRKTYDKRQVLAERDAEREARRAIARAGRGD